MNFKLTLFFVSLAIVGSHQKRLKVSVFYESLCSDSKNFINNYLTPALELIGSHIDLELVPYGKASHSRNHQNSYNFECQHGPLECYGNKVQACAVVNGDNSEKAMEFIDCAMAAMDRQYDYENQLRKCSFDCGIYWDTIKKCANSASGAQFLARFGDLTKSKRGLITFVPTVIVNDNIVVVKNTRDFPNFLTRLCELFPNTPNECFRLQNSWY